MPDIITSLFGITAVAALFGASMIGFLKLVLKQQALERLEIQRKEREKELAEADRDFWISPLEDTSSQ